MTRPRKALILASVLLVLELAHFLGRAPGEPFFNNDETRHVMTGVFFRDVFVDQPYDHLRDYTVRYYLQYPALGLLVWPPCFYVLEGLVMLVLGTSTVIAKGMVTAFAAMACVYLFRLVCRTHGAFSAAMTVLLFAFAPLVFAYSRQVMLEIPTLAFALAAVYHFVCYLGDERRLDLVLATLAAALAALTRFDAVYLVPLFGVMLVVRGRLGFLRRKAVWLAAALAVLVVLPVYVITAREFGWVHAKSIQEDGASLVDALLYYPRCLPEQMGWFAVAAAFLGLAVGLQRPQRFASWPYLAMIVVTYAVFTPMGERTPRHAIYWVPGFALFAAEGAIVLGRRLLVPKLQIAVPAFALAGTCWLSCSMPAPFVRGYEAAAIYVVTHTTESPCCLFDSYLNGDFIYHVRRADPDRKLWVLRGDKLFYSMLSEPTAGYKDHARSEKEVMALLTKFDPEWIVVEDPQVHYELTGATTLRAVLRDHPENYQLEAKVNVVSNVKIFEGVQLLMYRSTNRNYQRERQLEVEMLGLGQNLGTIVP